MHFSFFLLVGRFSIGCGSEFRAEVAYLEVGSSDFEQIHEKNIFDEIRQSPILHAPRDIISRKGKSLTPIYIYIYSICLYSLYIYIYIFHIYIYILSSRPSVGSLLLAQSGLPPLGPVWASAEASVEHPQKLLLGMCRSICWTTLLGHPAHTGLLGIIAIPSLG